MKDVDHGPLWNSGYIPLSEPPGNTYYFRMGNCIEMVDDAGNPIKASSASKDVSPVLTRTIQIQQMPADYGRREIAETKLVGPDGR